MDSTSRRRKYLKQPISGKHIFSYSGDEVGPSLSRGAGKNWVEGVETLPRIAAEKQTVSVATKNTTRHLVSLIEVSLTMNVSFERRNICAPRSNLQACPSLPTTALLC